MRVKMCDITVFCVNDKPVWPISGCITILLSCAWSLVNIEVCVCVCLRGINSLTRHRKKRLMFFHLFSQETVRTDYLLHTNCLSLSFSLG